MAKKNKTVRELNLEFEILSERVKMLEGKSDTDKSSEAIGTIERIEAVCKSYDKQIEHLNKLLEKAETEKIDASLKCKDCEEEFGSKVNLARHIKEHHKKVEVQKCRVCDAVLKSKSDLKKHIQEIHPKVYKCNICDETFSESWKMEKHIKTHESAKISKCNICEKEFYTKWRLEKHIAGHKEMEKCCHYYNNGILCPYDDIGCKFKHKDSDECKYDKYCNFKLCQYKHTTKADNLDDTNDEWDEDEENVTNDEEYDESEDDSLTDDETLDLEPVSTTELEQNQYDDCNGCSKILR